MICQDNDGNVTKIRKMITALVEKVFLLYTDNSKEKAMKITVLAAILTMLPFQMQAKQIIPAGTIVQCTTSESRISSKTMETGDPVLCKINRLTAFGHSVLPYGSYLSGDFEEYKDPGHFYGKGWMVLKFDRILVSPGTSIPIDSKVVDVPKYIIDRDGKILGKGHETRDIVTWLIPILWPIDLLELPRRGPRPTLRSETRIAVKIMDDVELPKFEEEIDTPIPDRSGPVLRERPVDYYVPRQQPAPQVQVIVQAPQPQYIVQPTQYVSGPTVVYMTPPPPPQVIEYAPAPLYARRAYRAY